MSPKEHLIENAIFGIGKYGKSFEDWKAWERKNNANLDYDFSYHATDDELKLIWDCAEYVIYTLFSGPDDFKKRRETWNDAQIYEDIRAETINECQDKLSSYIKENTDLDDNFIEGIYKSIETLSDMKSV